MRREIAFRHGRQYESQKMTISWALILLRRDLLLPRRHMQRHLTRRHVVLEESHSHLRLCHRPGCGVASLRAPLHLPRCGTSRAHRRIPPSLPPAALMSLQNLHLFVRKGFCVSNIRISVVFEESSVFDLHCCILQRLHLHRRSRSQHSKVLKETNLKRTLLKIFAPVSSPSSHWCYDS